MRLPNAGRAEVDLAKLTSHDHGKHQARVFASALGIRRHNAGWLPEALLEAAHGEAQLLAETGHARLPLPVSFVWSAHFESPPVNDCASGGTSKPESDCE